VKPASFANRSPCRMSAPTNGTPEEEWGWFERYIFGLRRYFVRRALASEVDDLVQDVFIRMRAHANCESIEHLEGICSRLRPVFCVIGEWCAARRYMKPWRESLSGGGANPGARSTG
jgi:hypothetical protein